MKEGSLKQCYLWRTLHFLPVHLRGWLCTITSISTHLHNRIAQPCGRCGPSIFPHDLAMRLGTYICWYQLSSFPSLVSPPPCSWGEGLGTRLAGTCNWTSYFKHMEHWAVVCVCLRLAGVLVLAVARTRPTIQNKEDPFQWWWRTSVSCCLHQAICLLGGPRCWGWG